MDASDRLAEVIRVEGAGSRPPWSGSLGDWSLAEEAVQEAAIAALRDWSAHGLPDHPRAWLTATARRKAIDIIRRERPAAAKEQDGSRADGADPARRRRPTRSSTTTCSG